MNMFCQFFTTLLRVLGCVAQVLRINRLYMGVDLKVLVLSVVCDDLLYPKMTCGES